MNSRELVLSSPDEPAWTVGETLKAEPNWLVERGLRNFLRVRRAARTGSLPTGLRQVSREGLPGVHPAFASPDFEN